MYARLKRNSKIAPENQHHPLSGTFTKRIGIDDFFENSERIQPVSNVSLQIRDQAVELLKGQASYKSPPHEFDLEVPIVRRRASSKFEKRESPSRPKASSTAQGNALKLEPLDQFTKVKFSAKKIQETLSSEKQRGRQRFKYENESLANALIGQNQDKYYQSDDSQEFQEPLQPRQLPSKFNWRPSQLIGQGSFGKVYFAMNLDTGQQIAVKMVELNGISKNDPRVRALETEVNLLSKLQDKNIVQYYGMQRTQQNINIFLEFVGGGSLASIYKQFGPLQENVIRAYTREVLFGLRYLHKNGVMHRDIKGANVLVDKSGTCKLADFGSSKQFQGLIQQDLCTSLCGTPNWMAPEVMEQENYGRKADIWSVGCTIIELATGKPPWGAFSSPFAALYQISQKKEGPPIPETLSDSARDFLTICFQINPRNRWTAKRLLDHPWLQATDSGVRPRNSSRVSLQSVGPRARASSLGKSLSRSRSRMLKGTEDLKTANSSKRFDFFTVDNEANVPLKRIVLTSGRGLNEFSVEEKQNFDGENTPEMRKKSQTQEIKLFHQRSPTKRMSPGAFRNTFTSRIIENGTSEGEQDGKSANQSPVLKKLSQNPPEKVERLQILESSQESSKLLSFKVGEVDQNSVRTNSWGLNREGQVPILDFIEIAQKDSNEERDDVSNK